MTVYRIPTSRGAVNAHYEQRSALDGRDYLLTFQWNQREGYWYLDLADEEKQPIAMGLKLVARLPLLIRVQHARRPPGEIICVDLSVDGSDPALESWGVTHELYYYDAEELGRL
jgi:hypothetical protein